MELAVTTPAKAASDDPRLRVLALLKRWGWNVTSFQVLGAGFSYWFYGTEAVVAYVDTGSAWVAAGSPIAPESELVRVARAFTEHARENGRRVAFFATERRFVDQGAFDALLIGEQPSWHPETWAATVENVRSLREQLRRARARGVAITRLDAREVGSANDGVRPEIEALIARWLDTKPMQPMGFLVRIAPFAFAEERRLFVARCGDRLVGFASVVPVYARKGWFIENLVRAPDAPNGTTELLVDSVMRDAAATQSEYVTLGLAPLAGAVPAALRRLRTYVTGLYDFAGLHSFKAKFRPREWASIHLSYPPEQTSHAALYDSLAAFARGGLLRYGLETLLRGPPIVVRVLALLLVPWTAILAGADTEHWFPSPWVQWFWVTFDIGLAVALFSLGMRWRPRLASALVVLIACDAIATFLEVVLFDVPRLSRFVEGLVVTVAIAAPLLAAVVLRNARRRSLRSAAQ
ncbi:MAG TPA: DUF2156 domain-containing protein [Polyangiaceae bacterium]